jgi:hypothetical protein
MKRILIVFVLPFAACSLVATSKVAPPSSSPASSPDVDRQLNYITSNLDQAEAGLKDNRPDRAKAHLDSANAEIGRALPGTRARPEFAMAKKRYDDLAGKSGGMAKGQEQTARGKDALRDASQKRQSAKSFMNYDERTAIPHLEMAVKTYQECIDVLKPAIEADPSLPQQTFEKDTGAQLLDSCQKGRDTADAERVVQIKKAQDKAAKIVLATYKKKWPDATGFYDRAQKRLAKNDDFAIINANSDIHSAVSVFEDLALVCKEHVTAVHNEALQVDKALTAGDMCTQANERLAKSRAQAEDIGAKYQKAYEHVQDKIMASLHGGRAQLVKQQGLPSWFDGADLVDAHEWFSAMLRSSYYRYDSSSGCQVTYYFNGNSMTRTSRAPAGCSG